MNTSRIILFGFCSLFVTGSVASAQSGALPETCFRIDRVKVAGDSGYALYRPNGFRSGAGARDFVVLEQKRTVNGQVDGVVRTTKTEFTKSNKQKFRYGQGMFFADAALRKTFGTPSGSPAFCAHWLRRQGSTRTLSDDVCFRLGGSARGLNGVRSGTIGYCDVATN